MARIKIIFLFAIYFLTILIFVYSIELLSKCATNPDKSIFLQNKRTSHLNTNGSDLMFCLFSKPTAKFSSSNFAHDKLKPLLKQPTKQMQDGFNEISR